MQYSEENKFIKKAAVLVYGFIFLSLLFRFYNHALLHQLKSPTIFETGIDFAYWFYQILNLDNFLVKNNTIAILFDLSLFICCIVNIIFTKQRFFYFAFPVLYFLYFLSFNSYVAHHTGPMDGILLITFAFWCTKENDFLLFWQAMRYFTLAMLVAAFVWKVFITGSFFNGDQAEAIVKNNLALYLFQNPTNWFSNIAYFILEHKIILKIGYAIAVCMQGAMAIGFFTKKYDKYLFWLPIIFHITTYFFVDVCFFELWVLNFTLVSETKINTFATKIKSIFASKNYDKKNYSKSI